MVYSFGGHVVLYSVNAKSLKKHHAVALSLKKGFVTLKLSLEEHKSAKLRNWGRYKWNGIRKNSPQKKKRERKGKKILIKKKKRKKEKNRPMVH